MSKIVGINWVQVPYTFGRRIRREGLILVYRRKELEEILGLKHPRKVLIEEINEVPRGAERFFKGIYSDPEKLKKSLADLQRETTSILEVLNVRKGRFREWFQELPGSPAEAEEYVKETSVELKVRNERATMAEARVITMFQEQKQIELFPVEEELQGKFNTDRIILFPRVIEKIAGMLKVNADSLNKVVLVHTMVHLLIFSAEDCDQRTWARHETNGETTEALVHYYSNLFYRLYQYKELAHTESVWVRYLTVAGRDYRELDCLSREHVNAAMVFWRRNEAVSLREVLTYLKDFA
ncbi:MAG TPA: hypothetical protein VNT57_03440 [Desulfobacteria bacterium]|nr:hypothetical protein [Desulfobacteria bacterium]